MSENVEPRNAENLDYVHLFEPTNVRRRLEELEAKHKTNLQMADMHKRQEEWFKKQIELGKPLPPPPPLNLSQGEIEEIYGEKARQLAKEVLEKERKAYVDFISEKYLKTMLEEIAKKLRFLVYTVNEEGKAEKLKIFVERRTQRNHKGDAFVSDVMYVGDDFGKFDQTHIERFDQISRLRVKLAEIKDYEPYFNDDLKKLYTTCMDLANLEVVAKEKQTIEAEKPIAETPKKKKKLFG